MDTFVPSIGWLQLMRDGIPQLVSTFSLTLTGILPCAPLRTYHSRYLLSLNRDAILLQPVLFGGHRTDTGRQNFRENELT